VNLSVGLLAVDRRDVLGRPVARVREVGRDLVGQGVGPLDLLVVGADDQLTRKQGGRGQEQKTGRAE
jgi:hypothetical protein